MKSFLGMPACRALRQAPPHVAIQDATAYESLLGVPIGDAGRTPRPVPMCWRRPAPLAHGFAHEAHRLPSPQVADILTKALDNSASEGVCERHPRQDDRHH